MKSVLVNLSICQFLSDTSKPCCNYWHRRQPNMVISPTQNTGTPGAAQVYTWFDVEVIKFPHSLVTRDTLEVLRLFLYKRPLSLPTITGFPALWVLELNSVWLWEFDVVQQFLKSCPLLEKVRNWDMDYTERFGGGSDDNEGLCVGLRICCPKLVCLEYAGHMANAFSF
ncbi:hypothetical protein Hanom_Chr10g00886501 [Helianthus anomalus]